MNKTHKLKVRTARSCWKLLERCCPTSKVKGSDTTDFRHLTKLSGQKSLKVDLEVGPVEELRWTIVSEKKRKE